MGRILTNQFVINAPCCSACGLQTNCECREELNTLELPTMNFADPPDTQSGDAIWRTHKDPDEKDPDKHEELGMETVAEIVTHGDGRVPTLNFSMRNSFLHHAA